MITMKDKVFIKKCDGKSLQRQMVRVLHESTMSETSNSLPGCRLVTYKPFDEDVNKTMLWEDFIKEYETFSVGDIIKCNDFIKGFTCGQYYKVESQLLVDDGPQSAHVFVTANKAEWTKLSLKDLLQNFKYCEGI